MGAAIDGLSSRELWERTFPRLSVTGLESLGSGRACVQIDKGQIEIIKIDDGKTLSTFIHRSRP